MAVRFVSEKAGERIVLVDETQANRQTVEAYELITRKLRVSRVPLLFRALAGEKALLPCWQAMRPAVRLRAFEEGADELRASAARAAVEMGCPLIETHLEWAGYDVDEIDEIRSQVNVFHYQNAKLLLAIVVLREALSGSAGGAKETPRGTQRVPRGVPHEMGIVELVPEDADGSLLKLFKSIRAHLGLGVVADDFRAFGRWPKYLGVAWEDARKRDPEPRARAALDDLWMQAESAAAALPVKVSIGSEDLSAAGADPGRVRALVERFRRAMPSLTLDVARFKVQLDGPEDALDSPFPVRWKYINPDDYMPVGLDEPVDLRAGDPVGLEED